MGRSAPEAYDLGVFETAAHAQKLLEYLDSDAFETYPQGQYLFYCGQFAPGIFALRCGCFVAEAKLQLPELRAETNGSRMILAPSPALLFARSPRSVRIGADSEAWFLSKSRILATPTLRELLRVVPPSRGDLVS